VLALDDLTQAKWQSLHFVRPEDEGSLEADLRGRGLAVFEITGREIESKDQLLAAIASAMNLPDYFGMNWDALDECLRDPDWLPAGGCVLFFRDADPFWRRASQIAGTFAEIWLSAAEEWGREGAPFHLVFVW
jgi:RNAse (barnase) inhibitor barstar